jgi:ArsR family transcriptional regulator, arsenate/arsenite/antimonite-responsive transcriptional repressor
MKKAVAIAIFETLASGVRLDVYRLLVKAGADGMVAGGISAALHLPPANLSFHLRAMTQSGLLTVEQEGRFLRYRADLALMAGLVDYLTAECCAGHPEICAAPARRRAPSRPVARPARRRATA